VQHVTVLNAVGYCNTVVSVIILYCNIMGPPSYIRSVVNRNVVILCMGLIQNMDTYIEYVCMYVCMHACMHVYMYEVYIYVYMYICMLVFMYEYMYVCMYSRIFDEIRRALILLLLTLTPIFSRYNPYVRLGTKVAQSLQFLTYLRTKDRGTGFSRRQVQRFLCLAKRPNRL
jgi:hypothetical protein